MTVHEALQQFPKIEADLLLAHVLKKPKEFLFIRPEFKLAPAQGRRFQHLAKKRLLNWPIAYLLGYKDFCGLRFEVNRSVLIPRPETERLVEMVLQEIKRRSLPLRVLDLGTGSGCIIISIAKHLGPMQRRRTALVGSDISHNALAVARRNAKHYKVRVKLVESDLLKKIPRKFDIIIANLPYVSLNDYEKLQPNLKLEPKIALTDGTKTWNLYKNLFRQLPKYTGPQAAVFLEIDPASLKYIKRWQAKYIIKTQLKHLKDLRGLERYAVINFS